MKTLALYIIAIGLLASCGHNIAVYSKGVGAELAWRPNTIMPSLRFGSYENLDLVQKENNQVRYTSNSGVGVDRFGIKSLLTGKNGTEVGAGTVLEVKTGPQINGYVADVLANPDLKKEHVDLVKAVTEVDIDLGGGEARVGLLSSESNATPVVTTEKGVLGDVTITTPTNEYTEKAIQEQVKSNSIHDVMKAWGMYIVCALIVLILALAFVIVHFLGKTSDLKQMVEDIKEIARK